MTHLTSAFRPSGVSLPLFLRKKWNGQQATIDGQVPVDSSSNSDKIEGKDNIILPVHPKPNQHDMNTVFTAEELEHRIQRAAATMIEMQKQLYRGEEMYHEETNSHGNLFIRWDAFIDIRDLSSSSNAQGTGSRRMPADNRWFSGSCKSVMRSSRPTPVFVKGVIPPPTPIPRSQAGTPLTLPPVSKSAHLAIPQPPSIPSRVVSSAIEPPVPPPSSASLVLPPQVDSPNLAHVTAPASVTSAPNVDIPTYEMAPSPPNESSAQEAVDVPVAGLDVVKQEPKPADSPEMPVKSEPLAAIETPPRRNTRKRKVGDV